MHDIGARGKIKKKKNANGNTRAYFPKTNTQNIKKGFCVSIDIIQLVKYENKIFIP